MQEKVLYHIWNDNSIDQKLAIYGFEYNLGKTDFFVVVIDNNGCKGSDTIVIEIVASTDQDAIKGEIPSIKVYPNPTNNKVYIEYQHTWKNEKTFD